ncbi:MAG: YceI family protein [Balneolaceae bacterium]|nr:YceI family protein [Balneolaceae bacterium]MBO6547789.1 YceI family protein [Balneolaceae bacterium]MBO6648300.1 YceI family protein [Balneolaceae bacterium]
MNAKLLLIPVALMLLSCTKDQNPEQSNRNPIQSNESSTGISDFIGKDYLVDDQHSYIGFKIKYFGFSPVRGRFNEFDGTAFYDPENLSALSVTFFIDVRTINTGDETRDEDLRREGTWFDAANHPYATFQSKRTVLFEDGSFNLIGDLSIKGISKEITVEFEEPTPISRDWAKNEQVDFSGKAVIDRQDFDVFGGSFWSSVMENGLTQLSDEVELEMDIHIRRADYQARYEDAEEGDTDKVILDLIKSEGVESGLDAINNFHSREELRAGTLSTVGYTLNAWEMYEEAGLIFKKKEELFGTSSATLNQQGINFLLQNNIDKATQLFKKSIEADSINSRAVEYLKLLNND